MIKTALVLTLLLAIASCAAERPDVVEVNAPRDTAEAMSIIRPVLVLRVETAPSDIIWTRDCIEWDGLCYRGLTYNCFEMYIWRSPSVPPVSNSALAHEMMHCALDTEYDDPDRTHSRAEWSRVTLANDALRAEGL